MRIAFTSDTHLQVNNRKPEHIDLFKDVRHVDVLVHCGDATVRGTPPEIASFSAWFKELDCPIKLFVPGNHDILFQTNEMQARHLLDSSITCLMDESIVIDGVHFYGSPILPAYGPWAFGLERGSAEMRRARAAIPHCDVLITHCPPGNILDRVNTDHAGCDDLYRRVVEIQPTIHAFGHVHEGYGSKYDWGLETLFLNVACCNHKYRPENRPLIADI